MQKIIYFDSLIEKLQTRMDVNNSYILRLASKSFNLHEVFRRNEESQEGVRAFIEYNNLIWNLIH